VTLAVYDVLGRKVRTLVDQVREPASYVVDWDGRADDGARASAGIYFYKLVSGDRTATRKAVRLR
jgi:flagellar hook assembly protein FlgD